MVMDGDAPSTGAAGIAESSAEVGGSQVDAERS